jgi:hypothetical protein
MSKKYKVDNSLRVRSINMLQGAKSRSSKCLRVRSIKLKLDRTLVSIFRSVVFISVFCKI